MMAMEIEHSLADVREILGAGALDALKIGVHCPSAAHNSNIVSYTL